MIERMNTGSAGYSYFQEILGKAESCRRLMSKAQKLQLVALRRRAAKHDLLADWQPLIDRVFVIWEAAIGTAPLRETLSSDAL